MIRYDVYYALTEALDLPRRMADSMSRMLRQMNGVETSHPWLRATAGLLDVMAIGGTTHRRPPYGIDAVPVGNRTLPVIEEAVDVRPFGTLLRFRKTDAPVQPKLLIVAPMSGHYATLLRGTVRTALADHDVYVTDWHNARDVPVAAGRFGLDDYVGYLIAWLEAMGGRNHVLGVCQPTVAVLAAGAVMAQARHPSQPRSMTLMAGPIDARVSPTRVNDLASSRPIAWFERELIQTVPWPLAGHGRRVYPGHTQVTAFMLMNLHRHVAAQYGQVSNMVRGDWRAAAAHRTFYDEYLAVMDLPAEFYLETVARVFQTYDLARGALTYRGQTVDPGAIRHTFVFTVEGELDDICAIGQTSAALDLCTGLRPSMKRHHLQLGVGHYGVFSGRRWTGEVYPLVREVIAATS
ncbi:polyhydroxyalkanoate depolymerase [Acidisphaera rubrifaciens]|uniref:Polyhydroxyalkanoate depolymerase n=1 Tax=Acidisphaera rubrifaciens HS-AP3 TaxID=1231350 RepID=A0A0D6P9G5_9PROT|nr:polyhydroxyalkanoate depolymerase [Acidisphaera rubrifaciens]GAN78405.1 polyhydroxyalkanoate depolymerase [Acidisphaera rubrifaciens HS-AP3]